MPNDKVVRNMCAYYVIMQCSDLSMVMEIEKVLCFKFRYYYSCIRG